jgi:hypothetical protein
MSEISVVVVGSTSISSVVGNGDTVNVNVGNQTVGGGNGAAATIEAGTVTTVDATQTATVTNVGTAYAAKFNFSLPRGLTGGSGPANSLSVGSVSTGATAAVSISGAAPSQSLSFVLQPGPTGPANSLSIGSVSTGTTSAVSISGTAPSQSLSFVLQPGPAGPANSLSIGSVTTGATAVVSISGSAPSQSISFVLPVGPKGDTGTQGPAGPPINLGDETPQPLGLASAGTALTASRADHSHDAPIVTYSSLLGTPSTFAPSAHQHPLSDISGLQAALDAKASLVNGTVPSSMLPSFVDDVIDVGGTLPASGDVGKIYVVSTGANTNKIYRWSGSTFIEISPSPGSTDTVTEGSTNLYYTNIRAAAAAPVQSVAGRTGIITLSQLGSSGTASATTFLRGDGAWAEASGSSFTGTVDGGDYTGVIAYDNSITVIQQPTSQTAASGAATFSIVAVSLPGGRLSYQWQRQSGSSWVAVTGGTSASLSLTGLTNAADNAAQYRVVLSSQSAAGVTSNAVTLGVDPLVPDAPTNVAGYRGDSRIRVAWDAPASNGGSVITDYVIQYSLSSSGGWVTYSDGTSTGTQIFIEGIAAGSYYLRVAAVNAIGQGPWSAVYGPVSNAPAFLFGSSTGGGIGASWSGLGEPGSELILSNAYYSSSSSGPVATITARYSGRIYFSWTSTGSNGRSVEIYRGDGAALDNRKSSSNFTDVSTNGGITIYFYPADSADRLSITAYLVQ